MYVVREVVASVEKRKTEKGKEQSKDGKQRRKCVAERSTEGKQDREKVHATAELTHMGTSRI